MTIDTALVHQYGDNIRMKVQQNGSRLRKYCQYTTITGESKSDDWMEPIEAQELQGRHADTPNQEPQFERRWMYPRTYVVNQLLDTPDKVRMLEDPTSKLVVNEARAIGRRQDAQILAAANATVVAGKGAGSTIPFPAGNTIDVDYVESGSPANSGLTLGKLRRVRALLDDAKDEEDEMDVLACTSFEIQNLLATTEATSADFNTVKALVHGEINTFMGFKFQKVRSTLMPVDSSDYRTVFAWAKEGMTFGEAESMFVRVTERADKNYSTQAYARWDGCARRDQEELVYAIVCDRSP